MNSWEIVDLQDISLFDPAFFEMVRDVIRLSDSLRVVGLISIRI